MSILWAHLPSPFFCLAPMDGATDTVFRQVITRLGRPDLMFTEFASVEGLYSKGRPSVLATLAFTPIEKPLIAQLWGLNPDYFYAATKEVIDLGFDGIDLNFGCPDKAVIKKGTCSAMINQPQKALAIIKAVQSAANGKIPISVKTRIGFDRIVTDTWISTLLKTKLDALTIHPRTALELSKVPARWSEVAKVVALKNTLSPHTKIIGNGDVLSLSQGRSLVNTTGVDGIMIGRGVFHNPWVFNPLQSKKTKLDKLQSLNFHTQLFFSTYNHSKNFQNLKRFVKIYVKGFKGAKKLTHQLMSTSDSTQFKVLLSSALADAAGIDSPLNHK